MFGGLKNRRSVLCIRIWIISPIVHPRTCHVANCAADSSARVGMMGPGGPMGGGPPGMMGGPRGPPGPGGPGMIGPGGPMGGPRGPGEKQERSQKLRWLLFPGSEFCSDFCSKGGEFRVSSVLTCAVMQGHVARHRLFWSTNP